jgi:hypothetical protein
MAKISKKKLGEMINDPLAPRVSNFKHHFNPTELKFLYHAINRKHSKQVSFDQIQSLNLLWTLDFLQKKQNTFGNVGFMLNTCLQGKIKTLIANQL